MYVVRSTATEVPTRRESFFKETLVSTRSSMAPSVAELTIGLGRPQDVVTFKMSAEPPCFISHGTGSPTDTLVFYRDGHWSEFGGDQTIPLAGALIAVN